MNLRIVPDAELDRAVTRALDHLARTQSDTGEWKGDYGGPMFLLPMYVCTTWATEIEIDDETRSEMVRYIRGQQNQDGGWGLHVEAPSYVFTSVLCYVAMRLLGVEPDDADAERARAWIERMGGPVMSAAWGKFMLAVLRLYDYEGLDPVQPELWLLPDALPIHPSRLWCHCRMVYLPMSWLYGKRVRVRDAPLIRQIRDELYPGGYDKVDWRTAHRAVSPADAYTPRTPILRFANGLLRQFERVQRLPFGKLRQRSLDHVLDHIRQEDENTNFICIGPVSKLLHTLIWYTLDPRGREFEAHRKRLPEYLWRGADGTKMQGYNSSELWDTAFAVQAALAASAWGSHASMLEKAHGYVEANQVIEDVPEPHRFYRHPCKGGWPFSNRAHGWPISDCTAEGLKAALGLMELVDTPIERERLEDAVQFLLSMQNEDGGWATYELTRGPKWLEKLNPSDCFAEIMIDYSYVECTSASVTALRAFSDRYPHHAPGRVAHAIDEGKRFLLDIQRPDGSFEGSWGVCFTYGAWFGVTGLRAAGLATGHPAIRKAVRYLERVQAEDGSWGETPESNLRRRYVRADEGQAVMTSWAMLALIAAGQADSDAVRRGVAFLLSRQQDDGSWPAEHIAGMFNKTSAIHYDNYLKIFPLWALGEVREFRRASALGDH